MTVTPPPTPVVPVEPISGRSGPDVQSLSVCSEEASPELRSSQLGETDAERRGPAVQGAVRHCESAQLCRKSAAGSISFPHHSVMCPGFSRSLPSIRAGGGGLWVTKIVNTVVWKLKRFSPGVAK